jgi:PAS domain-containing protein
VTSAGHALGSLCVLDTKPRELTPHQKLALRVLSRHVVSQLELRRSTARQRLAEEALQRSHAELERRVEERTREMQTARAEAEMARRGIEQMIDRISDGLVALDRDWCYTYVNENAGTMLGRDPATLIGKMHLGRVPGGNRAVVSRDLRPLHRGAEVDHRRHARCALGALV